MIKKTDNEIDICLNNKDFFITNVITKVLLK